MTNETQGSNGQLSEPHFDDEATLLSARRVVPFHKLADKTNSNWNLLFGATLAAALVMGVVGGVFYARLERTPVSKAETTERVTQPAVQEESVSSSVERHELTSAPDESTANAVDKDDQKSIDKPRNSSNSARKSVSLNPAPARRAARRTGREATREAQHSDDLFRIREIFEGSPRP